MTPTKWILYNSQKQRNREIFQQVNLNLMKVEPIKKKKQILN